MKRIIRFSKYYKKHIKMFTLDLIAAFLLAACDLFYPYLTRQMLNKYIPDNNLHMLVVFALILLGVYIAKFGLNYFVAYFGHKVGVDMQSDMRREAFNHIEELPLSYFDSNKTGTIMSKIVADLFDVSELAHHGPEDLFISVVLLIGSFILMHSIYPPLTYIVFSILPFLIFFTARSRRRMSKAFADSRVEIGEVNARLENSVSGIRVSKAYTSREYENELFEQCNERFVAARSRSYKSMAEFASISSFITDFLMIMMYVSGGLFLYYGKIDISDFTAFVLYISIFLNPVRRIVALFEQFQNGMTGFDRFCEIIDTPTEKDKENAIDIGKVEGKIVFDNVSFSYDDDKDVLSGISFTVEAGKTLALVGPSGGGKTTICHIIPRFYNIKGGSVTIDGVNIEDATLASLRKNIAIVSQDVFLFNTTIYENIAYGCPEVTCESVIEAAKAAKIHDYVMTLPEGYDTVVGERGVKLSGGQKQRIAIARAFLKNPPILILDEATSALDNVTEHLIQKSLEELCKGRTTIVVAHRLTTVKSADEILVITDKGLVERGTHEELVAQGGIYSGLWSGIA